MRSGGRAASRRDDRMCPMYSDAVKAVLDGDARYDDLGPDDQAVVRAVQDERMKATRESLNFEAENLATGQLSVGADAQGRVVIHNALSPAEVAERLGISRSTVARRVAAGHLQALKSGNRHYISPAEFERFRSTFVRELAVDFADDF